MQSCEHESCERIYRFYVCTAKKSEGPDVMINFSCHKKTYSCMFDIQPATKVHNDRLSWFYDSEDSITAFIFDCAYYMFYSKSRYVFRQTDRESGTITWQNEHQHTNLWYYYLCMINMISVLLLLFDLTVVVQSLTP